jgi:hypothetical protein
MLVRFFFLNFYFSKSQSFVIISGAVGSGVSVNVEALLSGVGGGGGFPPMLDIPPDADDETMVELAIALSLQDHEGAPNLHSLVNLQALQNLAGPALQVSFIVSLIIVAL